MGRVSGDPTAYWRAESAAVTESNVTFEKLTLTSKVCAVLVQSSIEFLEDAVDGGEVIQNAIGQALGLELDRTAIHGSGSGAEPEGILNVSGIGSNSMGPNGAAIADYADILSAIADCKEANFEPNALLYAPRTEARLAQMLDGNSNPVGVHTNVTSLDHYVTNQISTAMTQGTENDASAVVVGQWDQCLIGIRNSLMLEIFRGGDNNVSTMEVSIRAYLRADIQLRHPAAFSSVIGIIPAT
jgi:HK97 family phage major capsid protein